MFPYNKVLKYISFFSMLYLIVLGMGTYNIILSTIVPYVKVPEWLVLTSQHHMSLFLALSMLYIFLSKPFRKGNVRWYDVILALLAFFSVFYRFYTYHELQSRIGITTALDVVFGVLAVILIVEAVRRSVDVVLMGIVVGFILYGLYDVGFDLKQFIERIYVFNIGIFSTPLEVAVFMIAVFMFLASFLSKAGVAEYFTKFSQAFLGDKRGGPGKVNVIASALLGTVTGSATGDTVAIGSFTIPMMKKFGFSSEMAAAIAALSGNGAQIVPPVLGSAAFIMPLLLGVSYWTIVVASIIPAIFYVINALIYVDIYSIKNSLMGLPRDMLPPRREVVKDLYYFIPIAALVLILSGGYEPEHAAIFSTILMLLIVAFKNGLRLGAFYAVFLALISLVSVNALGIATEALILFLGGLTLILTLVLGMVKGFKNISKTIYESLVDSFKGSVSIVLTCAAAGIIAGVLSLSGLSYMISRVIWQISGGNAIVVLLLIMFLAILLGFGLPTPVVYVMLATMFGPLAHYMGVNPIVLHMFIFFYGVFAPLTPPVALATYAAASLAQANFWRSGLLAFRMTLAAWITAWLFFIRPELLIVTVNEWGVRSATNFIAALLGGFLILLALFIVIEGYFYRMGYVGIHYRIVYGLIALLTLYSLWAENLILTAISTIAFVAPILLKRVAVKTTF